jgi:hypothetical protein
LKLDPLARSQEPITMGPASWTPEDSTHVNAATRRKKNDNKQAVRFRCASDFVEGFVWFTGGTAAGLDNRRGR